MLKILKQFKKKKNKWGQYVESTKRMIKVGIQSTRTQTIIKASLSHYNCSFT